MSHYQTGILSPIPKQARYLVFSIQEQSMLRTCLAELAQVCDGKSLVVGLGQSLISALANEIPGLRVFPALANLGVEVPSTPGALWCWLRGSERGELYYRTQDIEDILAPAFVLNDVVDAFEYRDSRDLSGYEDGTENPKGDDALAAAIVSGQGSGMDGSSFVAVQQWLHDLGHFRGLSEDEQDDVFGRHVADNEEFDEAPESAHVKRTAQESYEPPAFIVRRSMPWVEAADAGLMFVAFGKSFNAFEAILNRMVGMEDNITDALFSFTRPINGAYYWCPPLKAGKLDLSMLGI
jgi:putative iron-dependent peroxidase